MSKPLSSIKSLPNHSNIKLCPHCGGTGSIVIRNAYDLKYEKVEPCIICGSTGFIYTPDSNKILN